MKGSIYIFLFIWLTSCIDEINLTAGGNEPKLVVDGWFSNDPSLSYVKAYYSSPFQSGMHILHFKSPDIDRIYVESELEGNEITFIYNGLTPYKPVPTFTPKEAYNFNEEDRYRLNIILSDQSHYQSAWQEVAPAATISDFKQEIIQKKVFIRGLNGAPFSQDQYFLNIDANIENQVNGEYGYYIKSSGIEEAIAVSDNEFCTCTCYVPYQSIYEGLNAVVKNEAAGSVIRQNIGSLSMGRIFRFYVKIDVYSLTFEKGKYLLKIAEQQKNTGSIFDPAPSKINGNIINLNDETEEVLGDFFTANHRASELMINRLEVVSAHPHLDFSREPFPEVNNTCLEYYTNGDIQKPIPFL